MRKGYGKCIWMDERKMKVKIKDGKKILNGKMEAWKVGMDEACPQCRVQVEEGKVNGWVSESGRQWTHYRKMEGGIKHLDIWMYPLRFMFLSFFYIFKEFVLFSHRCW